MAPFEPTNLQYISFLINSVTIIILYLPSGRLSYLLIFTIPSSWSPWRHNGQAFSAFGVPWRHWSPFAYKVAGGARLAVTTVCPPILEPFPWAPPEIVLKLMGSPEKTPFHQSGLTRANILDVSVCQFPPPSFRALWMLERGLTMTDCLAPPSPLFSSFPELTCHFH